MIKIAVDGMGGDHAPKAIFEGVQKAVQHYDDVEILLFGDLQQLNALIETDHPRIQLLPASQVITGEDEPVKSVRHKKDASLVLAARSVKEGQADALLSAGNTGALLAAGLLVVGRIKGVDRPGLMPLVPTINEDSPYFILMDAGANADSKADHLVQYAHLANYYAKKVLGIEQPSIGLINNGTEAGKGDDLRKEVYDRLQAENSLHFIGNIETKVLLEGQVNIAITDGFTGNAILKTLEGTAKSIFKALKQTLSHGSLTAKMGALLVKPSLKMMVERFDDSKQGGAVLLGVKHPVIKAHGSSNGEAIFNAIRQARTMVESGFIQDVTVFFEQTEGK